MTDLRSAIYDDIEEYEALCRYYNEEPVIDKHGPNPYCKHAAELEKRYRNRKIKNRKK